MPPPPKPRPEATAHRASGVASKEENIYIPSFISKRPFYAGDGGQGDYLEHQRSKKTKTSAGLETAPIPLWKAAPVRTKYKKGACENCGAGGHKAADCLHRQRKKGAKWTGKDIQADDAKRGSAADGWDAKRDRWFNYDPREYSKTVSRHEEMEELKRLAHEQEHERREADVGDGDDDDEGDKYAEEVDMGKHQPTSTKQLRIREDTAKYLLSLDLDSAKYDPKTRTLVNAGATADKAAELFADQGFLRGSGEAAEFESAQHYAWETQEKTGDSSLHLQANPTAGEAARKKAAGKAAEEKKRHEKELQEMYGVDEAAQAMPQELKEMVALQTETFT